MNTPKWDLQRLTTGERCALRRSAGKNALNVEAQQAFYKAVSSCTRYEEPYWYAVMCMEALWRPDDTVIKMPMERCIRKMMYGSSDSDSTKSLEHRMMGLLDVAWSDDEYMLGKLLNIVKIIKSRTNFMPDFEKLADDLRQWNHPDRYIQRSWLREIYSKDNSSEQKEEEKR